jgi:type I restriction enzyme S subunit
VGINAAIDITGEQRKMLVGLLHRYLPDVEVWAYGSRAKWTARPNSDLDLVAFTAPGLESQVAELKDALAECDLPFLVDLHIWDDIPQRFHEIIRKEYVVIQDSKNGSEDLGLHIGWKKARLGELVEIKHGWPFKSELYSEELTGKPIVMSIGNFNYSGGLRLDSTSIKEYRGSFPDEYELHGGDVLLVMTCQTAGGEILGVPGRIPDDGQTYLHNQRLGKVVVRDERKVELSFLYWLFLFPTFNRELVNSATGTKILHTAPTRIEAFEFALPPLEEQRSIARILWTLEKKIELNRKMNETLEATARALFQSWFVDFDPVRAKSEGRDPGLPPHVADLFPNEFEDSKLGPIAAGWTVGTLSDCASLNPESWSKQTRPQSIQYVDLSNVKWGRIEERVEYSSSDAPSRAQRVLKPGDTIVGTVRPGNGSFAFISENGLTGSTGFAVLRPIESAYTEFLYLAATAPENIERLAHIADGGAYPAVRPEVVALQRIVLPSKGVLSCFSKMCAPLFRLMSEKERESTSLTAMRDSLLPKLISGELRVNNTAGGIS